MLYLSIYAEMNMVYLKNKKNKMCFQNTNAPIMINSKDGQVYMGKYLDTSRKILSQEMTICNTEGLIYFFEVMAIVNCF